MRRLATTFAAVGIAAFAFAGSASADGFISDPEFINQQNFLGAEQFRARSIEEELREASGVGGGVIQSVQPLGVSFFTDPEDAYQHDFFARTDYQGQGLTVVPFDESTGGFTQTMIDDRPFFGNSDPLSVLELFKRFQ